MTLCQDAGCPTLVPALFAGTGWAYDAANDARISEKQCGQDSAALMPTLPHKTREGWGNLSRDDQRAKMKTQPNGITSYHFPSRWQRRYTFVTRLRLEPADTRARETRQSPSRSIRKPA